MTQCSLNADRINEAPVKPFSSTSSVNPARPARTRDEFLVFGSPLIGEEEIAEVVATLRSGWIGTGPKVAQFEQDFGAYKGSGHPVAVNSCTAALHVSLLAAGVRPGDEVITTPLTFCATVNAIIHAGARPVLADIDPRTLNIDPRLVEDAITSRTRAILPVHFAGRPCDMDALCNIAHRRKLKIIEDCAHAIEAEYDGQKAGTFGDFGCFSFYVTKNVMTAEGGMVLARNEREAARVKTLALHGMSKDAWKRFGDDGYKHYQVVEVGFKYNMTDIKAAMGVAQLRKLDRFQARRREIVAAYQLAFQDVDALELPVERPEVEHAWHLYVLRLRLGALRVGRDQFIDELTARNIGTSVHFIPIHIHPFYQQKCRYKPHQFPVAYESYQRMLSLPLHPLLTDADVSDVVTAVLDVAQRFAR